jgi:hypothetical protein
MTDRDTFAAAALTGIIANEGDGPSLSNTCAYAYRIADAMLRERGRAVRDNCVAGNNPKMECPVTEPMPKENRAEFSERKPAVWAVVRWYDRAFSHFYFERCAAEKYKTEVTAETCYRHDVVPLYQKLPSSLTDEEREAIEDAAGICEEHAEEYDGAVSSPIAATLRSLLARLHK